MTPARWRRISEIYYAASTLPEHERRALLDRQCDDDVELRREVESLLEYQSVGDDFLQTPAPPRSNAVSRETGRFTGRQLGSYEVRDLLGAGGMGEVYAAYDPRLGRLVAIKVLRDDFGNDPERFQRFEREARAAAALNHPNILGIFDIGTHEGTPYIVMEYVAGETLQTHLQQGRPNLKRALDIAIDIAAGLAAAHERGIVHRDLKPANVMITPDGRAKVLDFGIAKLLVPESRASTAEQMLRTQPGRLLGTPAYMAPEQLLGHATDHRSDVFSFGVILFELVTGQRLFAGDDVIAIGMRMLTEPIPSPCDVEPSVPRSVSRFVARMLEREPPARPQSAGEVGKELARLRKDFDQTWARRRTVVRAASMTLVLGSIIALAGTMGRQEGDVAPISAPPVVSSRPLPVRLGVLPAQYPASRSEFDGWPLLIQSLIAAELTGVQGLGVLDPLTLNGRIAPALKAYGPDAAAMLLNGVRQSDADWMATTQITPTATGAELRLSLVDVRNGEAQFSTSAPAARDADLPAAVRTLSGSVVKYFQFKVLRAAGDKDLAPWMSLRDRNIDAVREFAQANEYLYRYQLDRVEPHLRRAIELDPSFIAPRIWYISSLTGRGRRSDAERQLATLKSLATSATPFERAMIDFVGALITEDAAMQASYLQLALTYSPANNILLVNLAAAQARRGECAAALTALRGPVEMRWDYPDMYALWGACAIIEKRLADARRVLLGALELPAVDVHVYALLEGVELALGNADEAHKYGRLFAESQRELKRFVDLATIVDAYNRLARHCEAIGEHARARALMARLSELESETKTAAH